MTRLNRLTPLLEQFVSRGPSGCSLHVARSGETLYEHHVGMADLEHHRPVGPDTLFRIYSMTKLVTCAAALMLYERGVFLLNDPLEEYLPEYANPKVYRRNAYGALSVTPASRSIRIQDLFTMSSGLTYGGDQLETSRDISRVMKKLEEQAAAGGEPMSAGSLARELAAVPLAFDPGTHWQYGFSHDVLGALIEVWSGKTFGQFLQEEVFAPLGMKNTFFRLPEDRSAAEWERLAALYNRSPEGQLSPNTQMDGWYQPDSAFESGGAGLLSTLSDYAKFAQMLARGGRTEQGDRLLSSHTIRLMSTNHLSADQLADFNWHYLAGYGYGLGVRTMIDPPAGGSNSSNGEFGWCGMAGSWVMIDPSLELTAVYMQQMLPNFEEIHQARLRSVIYGALDD